MIMNNRKIFYNNIIVAVLFSFCIYSQDCDGGYTYIESLPEQNFNNINNENNCFNDNNIAVLNELISLNNLDNYNSCLELGPQIWVAGNITSLVVTYIQGGNNGITQKISEIPENIGQHLFSSPVKHTQPGIEVGRLYTGSLDLECQSFSGFDLQLEVILISRHVDRAHQQARNCHGLSLDRLPVGLHFGPG